jgi:hypothetical protein
MDHDELFGRQDLVLEEPAQDARKVCNRWFQPDPDPGFRQMRQQPVNGSVSGDRAGRERGREILVGRNPAFAQKCSGVIEQGGVDRVAADCGQSGELFERTRKRNRTESEGWGRNRGLAFQGARLRRCLARRALGFGRQIGSQPFADAALQHHGAITLPDEFGGRSGARQLVWIRVVHHDLAVARQ